MSALLRESKTAKSLWAIKNYELSICFYVKLPFLYGKELLKVCAPRCRYKESQLIVCISLLFYALAIFLYLFHIYICSSN